MTDCEMCGKKSAAVKKAKIEGLVMSVCLACATYGEEVTLPKKVSAKIIRNYAPREYIEPDANALIIDKVGQLIKQAREQRGLKQEQVAKQLNEKESIIHNIESNKFKPSLKLARKLEKYFNVTLVQDVSNKDYEKNTIAENQYEQDTPLTMGDLLKQALEKK